MKKPLEQAKLFLLKAGQDEALLEAIKASPQVPDTIFGFHAQQAAEKMLKALLSARGVRFAKTHDIDVLVELIQTNGEKLPPELQDIELLDPFAVEYRYDEIPEAEPPLDRAQTRELLASLRRWVELKVSPLKA